MRDFAAKSLLYARNEGETSIRRDALPRCRGNWGRLAAMSFNQRIGRASGG